MQAVRAAAAVSTCGSYHVPQAKGRFMQVLGRRMAFAGVAALVATAFLLWHGRSQSIPDQDLSNLVTSTSVAEVRLPLSAKVAIDGGRSAETSVKVSQNIGPASQALPAQSRHYTKLEFAGQPTGDQVRWLRQHGVRVAAFVPPHSLLVGLPDRLDVRQIPGLVGEGRLLLDEKMGPQTRQRMAEATADESVLVFAEFCDGVSGDEAREAAAADGLTVLPRGGLPENVLLARGLGPEVERLASRDVVMRVINAPQRFAESPQDIIRLSDGTTNLDGEVVPTYTAMSAGWDGNGLGSASLKYYFGRLTYDLDSAATKAQIVRALNTWAAMVAITWTQTSLPNQAKSVDISWISSGEAGYPFDGSGGSLARSWYPSPPNPETIAGNIECDDADLWEVGNPGSGFDVYSMVLHELGHALGLGHSESSGAVMYPYIWPNTVHGGLTADDVSGIQSIYASTAAPTVMQWQSVASHGAAGNIALTMANGYVEARSSGLRTIRVTFTRAIDPTSIVAAPLTIVGQTGGAVSLSGCTASLDSSGCVLTVTLASALADGDRYTMAVATTVRGVNLLAVPAGQQVSVGSLLGDADGSGLVAPADVLAARARVGQGAATGNASRDTDNSGSVTGLDMQLIVRQAGRSLP
jgi:hypothetical protein